MIEEGVEIVRGDPLGDLAGGIVREVQVQIVGRTGEIDVEIGKTRGPVKTIISDDAVAIGELGAPAEIVIFICRHKAKARRCAMIAHFGNRAGDATVGWRITLRQSALLCTRCQLKFD